MRCLVSVGARFNESAEMVIFNEPRLPLPKKYLLIVLPIFTAAYNVNCFTSLSLSRDLFGGALARKVSRRQGREGEYL